MKGYKNLGIINSQQKGKRFEREIAKEINRRFNTSVRRTPCSGGLSIKGDIIDLQGSLKDYHFECKYQKKLNFWKAISQAQRDCPPRKHWLVVFRRNQETPKVIMNFDHFLNLLEIIEELNGDRKI